MLDYLIKDISTSEGLLNLCNQLEKITESPNLVAIIAEIKTGLYSYTAFNICEIILENPPHSHLLEFLEIQI